MVLGGSTAHVELLAETLGDGDVVVTVSAHVWGFVGLADAVVVQAQWAAFLRELGDLDRHRSGQAELNALATGDVRLRIFSTDRAGHMAIEGELRRLPPEEGSEVLLRFGPVAFDPSLLPGLVESLSGSAGAG